MAAKRSVTRVQVTLPISLRRLVEQRVTSGGFVNASDYIGHLLRRELAEDRFGELVQEGLDSGPATPLTKADWKRYRRMAGELGEVDDRAERVAHQH
ncbi:MAG TPA: ribbon-helix-helix domain-containing protein [Planctomycetota bacterium]|nr:ribbon-helix-helix domain-containing protein [Planctomycetota bacterium]